MALLIELIRTRFDSMKTLFSRFHLHFEHSDGRLLLLLTLYIRSWTVLIVMNPLFDTPNDETSVLLAIPMINLCENCYRL